MQESYQRVRSIGRQPLSVVVGLLIVLYAPLLAYWYDGWLNKTISTEHEYFSHGLIGLPFAAYLGWNNRTAWNKLPSTSHWTGLALLTLGVMSYLSTLPDLINLSLPLVLTGLCLWLKSIPGLSLQTFPLLLVWLATPNQLPYLIAPYTLPLQTFTAGMAGFILMQFGMDIDVNQIYLYVNDRIVEVAPYCAGLKMLFTSLYVGLMLLYWTGAWSSRAKTIVFFGGIIFLSVTANIIRNTLLTYLFGTGQKQAFDWLHAGWGGDLYSACLLGSLVGLLTGVEHLFSSTKISDSEQGL